MQRRTFLKGTLAGSAFALGATFLPRVVLAEWPKAAFEAKTPEDIVKTLFNSVEVQDSDKIVLKAPEIAENGAQVQIEISTDLPKVESIAVIAEQNPIPLIAQFNLTEGVEGTVITRIKMAKSGKLITIVKADGKLYRASKEIKVTVGGCGG